MRLYLIRHGQTCWNSEGRAQGHADVDLDETGRAQASLVADFFESRLVHRILSSDLVRCRNTAQPTSALTETDIELDPTLRERTFGELEGHHYTVLRCFFDAEAREKGIPRWEARPKGGESLTDVWERVTPTLKEILARDEETVIFSHGGALALILAQVIRAPIEAAMSFRFENGSITELKKLGSGTWQLQRYSDTSHLRPLSNLPQP
jgi:2,3-bisphosphoglycerate-dependent phosphoglycerate mutase